MATSAEVVLIKLGGSLITEKSRPDTARHAVIERLAGEIASEAGEGSRRLLVGHGSGSFGHTAASRHALGGGPLAADQREGITATQDRAAELHRRVVRSLRAAGTQPFSLAPSSFITSREGYPDEVTAEPLLLALESGLLPVIFGDVVMDHAWTASICSTETVFLALVEPLRQGGFTVRRALWLGDTDGVYDAQGVTIPEIRPATAGRLLDVAGASAGTDVTGGMRHRLEVVLGLARLGVESHILNGLTAGVLKSALAGDSVPGTRVLSDG